MLSAVHPHLDCHNIVPYPTQDMVSPTCSLSKHTSTYSPLKAQQAVQTRRVTGGAAYNVASSVQTTFPVVDAAVIPPGACEALPVQKAKTKGPPSSLSYFNGTGSQIRGDGSASKVIRRAQPLRHPPENWTGEEASQETCFHQEETRLQQKFHTGSEGNLHDAQAPEETAQEQGTFHRDHHASFECEEKTVNGILVTQNMHASPEAAGHAVLTNGVFSTRINPFTCLSFSHGARLEGGTDRMQDCASSKSCKSNLLRSVSADVTNGSSFALPPSISHSHEGHLGISGTQKHGCRDFRVAASSLFRNPPAGGSPSKLAEKSRVSHRIVPFGKASKRRGEREKKEQEAKLKCEGGREKKEEGAKVKCGEEQNYAVAGKELLAKRLAGDAPVQDDLHLSEQRSSFHCYDERWCLQRGKSPATSSSTKVKEATTRLASHSRGFTGAPAFPVPTKYPSSQTLFLCRELESRPHIFVRSYKTFQQECARNCRLHKPEDVAFAEDIPESDCPRVLQKPAWTGAPGACITHDFECRSSECEASRGIQRQFPFASKQSQLYPPTPHPSGGEDSSSAERKVLENEETSAGEEHSLRSGGQGTARYFAQQSPVGTTEDVEYCEDTRQLLPRRLLLKRLLGSGAMGRVYLVELDERPYAVKIALQSDPAACMYLKQGWRNLVHLEKIHQRRLRQATKQTKAPRAKNGYQVSTEQRDVLHYESASSAHQKATHSGGREKQGLRGMTSVESSVVAGQRSAKDRRKSKQFSGSDLLVRDRGNSRDKSSILTGEVKEDKTAATLHTENLFGLHHDVQELLSLHTNREHIKEGWSPERRQAILEEEVNEKCKSLQHRESFIPFPPAFRSGSPGLRQEVRLCRKSGVGNSGRVPHNDGGQARCGGHDKTEKRERYFCRPVAFLEGDWFCLDALQQEAPAALAAANNLKNLHLPRLQKTAAGQKPPSGELRAVGQVTAAVGPAACFASHSSRNSPPMRKHKHGWQSPVEQDLPPSTFVAAPVPVCAYIMEYIPDACQLTAVIWNLHRCLDPSHSLRRGCRHSLVAQRLVEIGIRVAEAHKCIAAEAGLYSFDFNPKNILVSIVSRGRKEVSPPPAAASSTKRAARCCGSSASPLAAGRSTRTGMKATTRQKEETKTSCNAAVLRCASPAVQQQQHLHQRTRQQQQQQKQLHTLQQHTQQQHTQQQHAQTNLSPADITRLVLCEPQVCFRVVAIDLDCSLQAPFSSSTAALPANANAAALSPSSTFPQAQDEQAPLLDWSCGRRVVYSCPHVSSITAAYIIAVLAKNKGEGQFTRSGLSEAAAHAALCCRIDSETNFLHYLWTPTEKSPCRYSEDEERETSLDAGDPASRTGSRKSSFPRVRAAARASVTISCSTEHLPQKEELQRAEDVSGRAEVLKKCALQPAEHLPVGTNDRCSTFCASCIPAEGSSHMYVPAHTHPSPAPTEMCGSPLLCACPPACTSPTEHTSPLPAMPSRGCSFPPLPTSHEEIAIAGSSSTTCRGETKESDPYPPAAHAENYSGCVWSGQPTRRMRGQLVHNPGTTAGSNNRSSNKQGVPLSVDAEDSGDVDGQGVRRRDTQSHTKKDVQAACSCLQTSHSYNTAVTQAQQQAAEKRTAFAPQQQQLYLPCFLYPRWGPKTPRGICQKDYKKYGVRLVGQHVNLQLLAFILCELLDFRSLHVVVLQRFGLELRALHLPTGICQMFSEQDQIISCLCFSALTRMTSAIIPPLRLLSLASGKLSPSRVLCLFPAESVYVLQPGSAVPSPFGNRTAITACSCQQVLKLQDEAKEGISSLPEKSGGSEKKQREGFDAAAIKNEHHLLSREEKCSPGEPAVHELTLNAATPLYSGGNCPALLLLHKPDTEEGLLLFPAAAAEGCSCSLHQPKIEGLPNSGIAVTDNRARTSATRVNSTSSSSSATARWCTITPKQGRREHSGERRGCSQEGSPRKEAGKKAAGQNGYGKTQAIRVPQGKHSNQHGGCVQPTRSGRLSRLEQASQSQHLSLFARCYATAATTNNSKVRLAAREGPAPGTSRPSGAVAAAVAAKADSRPRQAGQQRAQPGTQHCGSKVGYRLEACLQSPAVLQELQEEWKKGGCRTQQQAEVNHSTEGLSFGVCVGNQRLGELAPAFVAETQEAPRTPDAVRNRMEIMPSGLFSFEMLRQQHQLHQEQLQQEQQQKVRRLTPEDVSRMSVWDKVEQLPALNPQDFLPPVHLFGTACMQEIAALNAVLLQFLDPHPFFTLRYSSSTSAFDSIINALRQLKRRLESLREEAYR